MYICMYVCLYVCMRVCVCVYVGCAHYGASMEVRGQFAGVSSLFP